MSGPGRERLERTRRLYALREPQRPGTVSTVKSGVMASVYWSLVAPCEEALVAWAVSLKWRAGREG